MPRTLLASVLVGRLVRTAFSTAAVVESSGTVIVAVISTLAASTVIATWSALTFAASAMLCRSAVVFA